MSEVKCALCPFMAESLGILEGHINADHLDYFPYGCAYCGHWMPTEEIAHQHVEMKKHLPIKIKENLNWSKEDRLKELLETSRSGNFSKEENNSKSANEGNCQSIASSLPTSSNTQESDDGDNSSVSSSLIFEFEEHPETLSNERSGKDRNRDFNEKSTKREHQDELDNTLEDTNCYAIDETTYEESPTLNPPNSLQSCHPSSTQVSATRNPTLSDFSGDGSMGCRSIPAKKPNKHLRCLICQMDVVYSLVANHIYSVHIADKHAVKCAYCNFGTFYAKSDALRHVRAIHPHLPIRVIDRRKSHLRVAYNSWRSICFPNIGRNHRSIRVKAPLWLSNNAAPIQSHRPKPEGSSLNNESSISQVIQSSSEDQVKCIRCEKKFDRNKISSHLRDEHFADSKKFTCVGCSKSFKNLIDIQTHCQEQHKPATEYESNIETMEQFDLLLQQCLNDASTMNDVKSDFSAILLRK